MATVDASIPLGVNTAGFDVGKMISLADMAQQFKARQQAVAGQNALKAILANPGSIDPATGMPKPEAITKVMQVDPHTGMALRQDMLAAEQTRLVNEGKQTELWTKKIDIAHDKATEALDVYEASLGKGLPEPQARAAAQEAYTRGRDELASSGHFASTEIDRIPAQFDPTRVKNWALSYKDRKALERADAAEKEKEKHDRSVEVHNAKVDERLDGRDPTDTKWQVLTDPGKKDDAGNPIQYRYNPQTAQSTTLDGKPYSPAGAAKIGGPAKAGAEFTPQMGDLMGALAEEGISLPTGFRSKEQQVALYKGLLDRNPGKNAAELAKMLKTGQIEFGAQKKETQTAAGVAGKVEVAENEISEFVPLVREASQAVPRGKFVPITKLLQMKDETLSDPNLRALKIRINSTLNAYDMLAARGGTDVDKRKEVRSLLTSADSPEVLETALQSFELEAAAAHRAAVKATKVPELEGASKPVRHVVGDIIIQNGARYRATAVDKDGKVTAAEEAN